MLKLKLQYFGHLMWRTDSLEKDLMLGKIESRGRRGGQRTRLLNGWLIQLIHHWLNGHEFEQAPGVGDGHGSLLCFSPWGFKVLGMSEQLNWTEMSLWLYYGCYYCCCISQERDYIMAVVPARERLTMPAVPPATRNFFQLLSLHLAYPELSEQCE